MSGNRVMNLPGTTTWSGNTGVNNNQILFAGGTINNTGTWNDPNAFNTLFNNFSGTNAFNNSGTYNKQSNTITMIGTPFTNISTVNVNAGRLRLVGNDTDTGAYNVASGGTLDLNSGAHT